MVLGYNTEWQILSLSQAVCSVHVIFICRAGCFTGVHTCENTVKWPPALNVGEEYRDSINGKDTIAWEAGQPVLFSCSGHQ